MNQHWHAWSSLGKLPGWSHLHQIVAGKNLDGRLEIFAVSTDGSLWQIWQTAANNGWSHWESRGKPTAEGIERTSSAVGPSLAVGQNQDGRLVVCAVAAREAWIVQQLSPNNGWGRWESLGQPSGSGGVISLQVGPNRDGRLQVFTIEYANRLASRRQTAPTGGWSDWDADFPHDDRLPFKSFAIGQNEDGRLELVTDLSGILALVTQSAPGEPFRSGFGNAGITASGTIDPLTVARNPDGTLEAATAIKGRLMHLQQRVPNQLPSSGGGGWARHDLGCPAENSPVRYPVLASDRHGHLAVFAEGQDGGLWHRRKASSAAAWSDWQNLDAPTGSKEGVLSVAVEKNSDGRLEAFVVQGGELWHTWETQ